jgi:hypothetical protein
LGLNWEDVPKFYQDNPGPNGDMIGAAIEWLTENFGLSLIFIKGQEEQPIAGRRVPTLIRAPRGTLFIASYESPTYEGTRHAVIVETTGKKGRDLTLVHDPNPDGDDLVGVRNIQEPIHLIMLVPNNYARYAKHHIGPLRNRRIETSLFDDYADAVVEAWAKGRELTVKDMSYKYGQRYGGVMSQRNRDYINSHRPDDAMDKYDDID